MCAAALLYASVRLYMYVCKFAYVRICVCACAVCVCLVQEDAQTTCKNVITLLLLSLLLLLNVCVYSLEVIACCAEL
jgi:hypothetical protein